MLKFYKTLIILLVLNSCVFFTGERMATTAITSTPDGANAYIIHEDNEYDALYFGRPQVKNEKGQTMTFAGTTPFIVDVPKGKYTKIMITKIGYETTIFTVKAKKEATYFDGKNRTCMADKYFIYGTPFMIWDAFIAKYIIKTINNDFCKDIRHAYHINLKKTAT